MSVSDDILGSKIVSGAGSIIVEVNTDSSQDFSNLQLTGTETIKFTGNSTFTGDFSNSTVSINSGVTLSINDNTLGSKVVSGAGNIIVEVSANSSRDFSNLTLSGTETINFTGTSTFTGDFRNSKVSIDGSVSVDASIVSGKTISGTGTISVNNLEQVLDFDFSKITTTNINASWSGTGTYTGNLTNVDTLSITGTMDTNASIIDGKTISGTGALNITNLDASPNANFSKVNANLTVNANWSGTGTLTSDLTNIDTLSISSGTMSVDASRISGKTINGSGALNITNLDASPNANFSKVNANLTVNADWSGTGTYTGNLTGVDTVNISNGTMSVDASKIIGKTITGNGTLHILDFSANQGMDLSKVSATINATWAGTEPLTNDLSDIDTLNITGTLSVDASKISGKTISGTGTISVNNLEQVLDFDFSKITTTNINASWSGTGTYTGNLTGVDTLSITGTMDTNASIIDGKTISGTGTINVNNLEQELSFDFSKITTTNINASWSGTGTYTGNLTGVDTLSITGTMDTNASIIDGKTINGTGTLNITNLDASPNASLSAISSSLIVNADWAGTGTLTSNLASVDTLKISSGTLTINDSNLGNTIVDGTGNTHLIVIANDSSVDLSNVTGVSSVTINDSASDVNIIGSAINDTLNLKAGNDTVDLGAGSDTLNVAISDLNTADTLNGGAGSDTLNLTTSGNINSKSLVDNVSNFEVLNMQAGNDTINFDDVSSFDNFRSEFGTINDAGGNDTLAFGSTAVIGDLDFTNLNSFENLNLSSASDNISLSGDESRNIRGLGGDDTFSLDFSNIGNFSIDGGAGSDKVSLSGSQNAITTDTAFGHSGSFSNIEQLDITGLNLNTSDSSTEYEFTQSLISSWIGGGNSLTLTLSQAQANQIKFTSNGKTYDGDSNSVVDNASYDLGSGVNLIIDIA